MKSSLAYVLGAALAAACALPAVAAPRPASPAFQQSDQEMDRDRNTQAYKDGYTAGQADAGRGTRNDEPSSRWTEPQDVRAYREGYDAGYQNGRGTAGSSATGPAANLGHGEQQAEQFGYQDGLANGRKAREKGDKFEPTKGDMYKHADHGWSPDVTDKEHYRQMYREGYTRGYQQGFSGTGPK